MPHHRPWRLTWYLTVVHACWSVATATNILLVECRWKKDGYNSVATLTEMSLHQTWLLILCHSQICLLVQSTLSDMHAGLIYSDTRVCKVLLHQARHLVWTCLQVRCRFYGFVKLVSYHPGRHLELYQIMSVASVASLWCYKDDVCNLRISKISICINIPGVCLYQGTFSYIFRKKLTFWWPFCLFSYILFYFVRS